MHEQRAHRFFSGRAYVEKLEKSSGKSKTQKFLDSKGAHKSVLDWPLPGQQRTTDELSVYMHIHTFFFPLSLAHLQMKCVPDDEFLIND